MRISELAHLARTFDYDKLRALEPPPDSLGRRSGPSALFECLAALSGCFKALVVPQGPEQEAGQPSDSGDWCHLALVVGAYYAHLVEVQEIVGLPAGKVLPPGVTLDFSQSLLDGHLEETPLGFSRVTASIIMSNFLLALLSIGFVSLGSREMPSPTRGPFEALEGLGHSSLLSLHKEQLSDRDPALRALAGRLLHILLNKYKDGYQSRRDNYWNPNLEKGVFSSLRVAELAGLAASDARLVSIYGKRLPRVFEAQLALLAQSFGFLVVQARTGERFVDLLCISSDPSARFSFLVEAKTTKSRYSLPAADERALRDYVADVRATLTTLPELEVVLVVGPEPAKTIGEKVRALENKVKVPVRYCPVNELAGLREALPGPLPARAFLELSIAAPHVIPNGYTGEIVTKAQAEQQAHVALVRSLMPERRVGRDRSDSWGP